MTKITKTRKPKTSPSGMLDVAMAMKKAADKKKAVKAAKELGAQIKAQLKANKPAKETTVKKVRVSPKTGKKVTVTTKHKRKKGKTLTPYQQKLKAAMKLDLEINKDKYAEERKQLKAETKAYQKKIKADKAARLKANPPKFKNVDAGVTYFSDDKNCKATLEEAHKINGVLHCAYCKHNKVYRMARGNFKCAHKDCRRQFSVTTNTFLSKSKICITKVFKILLRDINNTTKYKVIELENEYSFAHTTAIRLLHNIRSTAFNQSLFKIEENSRVSADTTGIIGSDRNRHDKDKKGLKKLYKEAMQALTMKQENGNVIIEMVANLSTSSMRFGIRKNVPSSCIITTDTHRGFWFLTKDGYVHHMVNHNLGEHARGRISSNGAESVHAAIKAALQARFNSVNKKYLQQFINAIVFTKNTKHSLGCEEQFNLALQGIVTTAKPIKTKAKVIGIAANKTTTIPQYNKQLFAKVA